MFDPKWALLEQEWPVFDVLIYSMRMVLKSQYWKLGTESGEDYIKLRFLPGTLSMLGQTGFTGNIFDDEGNLLPDGKELDQELWAIIMQAFQHSADNCSTIDPQESLHDFFKQKVEERFPGAKQDRQRMIIMQMAELWGPFIGSPVTRQSLRFFWLEEFLDGENLFCAGTFTKILETIAESALKNADLKLSTKVTRIETNPDHIKVATDNGIEHEFDEVVVTVPLGYLKQNKDTFAPPLPPRLAQAVDAIGYGSLEKVYITFPRAFWLGDATNPDEKPFTGFTQWLSASYTPDTNPKRWNQELVDLATLPGSSAHPTLLFYIFGEQSATLTKELASLPSAEAKKTHVLNFFTPYFSLLPHYKQNSADCSPISWWASDWVLDPLAGNGSYSNFQTGLIEGDKDIEIMREGLPDRGLEFAGEHTAPFVALGTVTGAFWSGEGVAKRIADAYKRGPTSSTSLPWRKASAIS